ncbi:MAG: twin-arginine translocase TatA/TatE family subunit [Candidatus Omnitrophica bacterium]|nr:twin-arginine translocase TatA/TatE family subunit [Candidatus Omnitrophota bacterium]MDD5654645.1 twin-arginine translocase TatA/TatE family subunit [Candidatus Omnitrophota bacterium]
MFNIGLPELLLVLLICLLVFGATKLPEIGKSLGKSIRELKKAMKEDDAGDAGSQKPDDKI